MKGGGRGEAAAFENGALTGDPDILGIFDVGPFGKGREQTGPSAEV